MADWETTSGGSPAVDTDTALTEVINNVRLVDPAAPKDSTAAKEAARKGWAAPSATQTYQVVPKSAAETNAALANAIMKDPHVFAGNAVRYEYDGEQGDLGPVSVELQEELFGGEVFLRRGINFDE